MSQRLSAIILTVFLATSAVFAADAVRVPANTNIERGQITRITVTGSLSLTGSARIVLTYPANIFRVRGVAGGSGFLFRCDNVQINSNTVIGGTTAQLSIQCTDVVAGDDQPMFELIVEGMYNPDASGQIVPRTLFNNGSEVSGAEFVSGIATLTGDTPIRPIVNEGFTGNYPNPFSTNSRFVFTMREAGPVTLSVRNLQGRQVKIIETFEATAGENSYLFEPDAFELAQGTYLMQMQTRDGIYLHSFMVLR